MKSFQKMSYLYDNFFHICLNLLFFFTLSFLSFVYSQDSPANFQCGTPDSTIHFNGPIGTQTLDVVFVFLDFSDGRINGVVPTTDEQLNEVSNLDAVLNMGFVTSNGGQTYTKQVRKYTYDNFWKMFFSDDEFLGNAHPDWASHGNYGFPPDQDPAVAYGSFKEYFSEVSCRKLTINNPVTHSNDTGIYRTGIVNNILTINGRKIIEPILLNHSKRIYYNIPSDDERTSFGKILTDAHDRLIELHNNNEIEFDLLTHLNNDGRVIYVIAGSTSHVGGLTDGYNMHEIVLREKRVLNDFPDDKYKIINGLTLYCHEFGHALGLEHSRIGNYCVMTEGTYNQSCPSFFNIYYRLKMGWIDPQYVHRYRTNQNIRDLPPSAANGDCIIYTIYGDGGYSEPENSPPNYEHSEYYIFENRCLNNEGIKFDKRFVYQNGTYPEGFNGGCLITHHSNYSTMVNGGQGIKVISADPDPQMEVHITDEGHSRHFFGVPVTGSITFDEFLDPRTSSSFNLRTGINITNINRTNGNINFDFTYSLGEPPVYNRLFYGQTITEALNLSGRFFVDKCPVSSNITINPGAIFESVPSSKFGLNVINGSGNLYAVGTDENPILFNGVGYGQYVTNSGGLQCNSINNTDVNNIEIRYVNFNFNDILKNVMDINFENSDKNITVQNITCSGSGIFHFNSTNSDFETSIGNINFNSQASVNIRLDNSSGTINVNDLTMVSNGELKFDIRNSANGINISNINFGGNNKNILLYSTGTNRANLNSISNFNNALINVRGPWNFNLANDFLIPGDSKLLIDIDPDNIVYNDIAFTTTNKISVEGSLEIKGNLNYNRDIYISQDGLCIIRPLETNNYIKFSPNYGIVCNGVLDIDGGTENLYLTINGAGKWKGITCNNPSDVTVNNAEIMNAETGLFIDNPLGDINIQNSGFSENLNYDIDFNNFGNNDNYTRLIKQNIFTGNPDKIASVICQNSTDINIETNQFDEDYKIGIFLSYATNPVIKDNIFQASTQSTAEDIDAIYAYTSGGFIGCNTITNYNYGIELNNSSPFLYKNEIYNNGIGLFAGNCSNPILTPAFSPGGTLYIGGYNRIHDNLNEEIYADNAWYLPYSIPQLDEGYNSIFDEGSDCLVNMTDLTYPNNYNVKYNYWGGNPQNRLCPSNVSYVYEPYLSGEPDPPFTCDPFLESANNSNSDLFTLQFGSAVIDEFNGNYESAILKYKNIINQLSDTNMIYLLLPRIYYATSKENNPDYYALETYYSNISLQYSGNTLLSRKAVSISTSTDVEQPEYIEAVNEYQAVIENPINQLERHYAYIDQLRTIRLMLDSLLNNNGNGALNRFFSGNEFTKKLSTVINYIPESVKSLNSEENEENKTVSISKQNINNNQKIKNNVKSNILERIKSSINGGINSFDNLCLMDKGNLIQKIINYKLLEFSILNRKSTLRPLDRMKIQKKISKLENISNIPKIFKLYQNYPNPFNPVSTIKYDIPKESKVTIKVYDLIGREVITLINENKQPGYYEAIFDGSNLASGVYVYKIEAGSFNNVKKMVLIK